MCRHRLNENNHENDERERIHYVHIQLDSISDILRESLRMSIFRITLASLQLRYRELQEQLANDDTIDENERELLLENMYQIELQLEELSFFI